MTRLLGLLLLLLASPTWGATNLAATCKLTTSLGNQRCGEAWYYQTPAGRIVQSNGRWTRFDPLGLTAPVLTCAKNIPAGTTECPPDDLVSVPKSQLLPPPPPPVPTTTERITWLPPTQYVSGEVLSSNDPAYYNLKCGQAAGGPYLSVQRVARDIIPPATRVGGTPPATLGEWFCVVTAVSTSSRESAPSNEVSRKVIAAPVIQ